MHNSIKVAQWELTKSIKNKRFLVLTFLVPLVMLIIGGVSVFFSTRGDTFQLRVGIVDRTDRLASRLEKNLEELDYQIEILETNLSREDLKEIMEKRELDGVLLITKDIFQDNRANFLMKEVQNLEMKGLENLLNTLVVEMRLQDRGYPVQEVMKLTQDVNIIKQPIEANPNNRGIQGIINFFLPLGLVMMMILSSIFSGSMLMQGIIEEKNNRIVELIVSSISAKDLIKGKIMGYAGVGLAQIVIWATTALVIAQQFFDLSLQPLLELDTLYIFIYFILGFLLIATLNTIVGAAIKDPQTGSQFGAFIAVLPIVPLWFMSILISNPNSLLIKLFTYIPLFSPVAMMLRLGLTTVPLSEILITVVIVALFDYLLIIFASKIFRVGILMYGKNADFKDMIKWIKSDSY